MRGFPLFVAVRGGGLWKTLFLKILSSKHQGMIIVVEYYIV